MRIDSDQPSEGRSATSGARPTGRPGSTPQRSAGQYGRFDQVEIAPFGELPRLLLGYVIHTIPTKRSPKSLLRVGNLSSCDARPRQTHACTPIRLGRGACLRTPLPGSQARPTTPMKSWPRSSPSGLLSAVGLRRHEIGRARRSGGHTRGERKAEFAAEPII